MKEENLEQKEYIKQLNVSNARLKFCMRLQIVPGVKHLYKNKYKRSTLVGQFSLDSLSHTMWCPGLRNRDLNSDKDAVLCMKDVLRLREFISLKNDC